MRERMKRLMPKPLIELYKGIRYGFITVFFYLFRLFPIKKNRIVLMNVWGFGDNVKYVTEELIGRKKPYELIFICNRPENVTVPNLVTVKKTNTLSAIYALATAKVWVESNRKEGYIKKRKKQYYIQLWHGGFALKKIEGDCEDYLGETYIKRAKKDSLMTDLYVSNSTYCTKMYRRAFWFHGEIAEWGSPRMDLLLSENEHRKNRIKRDLGIDKKKKIVLYAPTYRNSKDTSVYELNYDALCMELSKRFGGEFIAIERLHPLVREQSSQLKKQGDRIDASSYKDMYELMLISDVLITDYSNTMFEFALMNRPVFLYAKDYMHYNKERGFYFDFPTLPFSIAYTQEELFEKIRDYEDSIRDIVQLLLEELEVKETGKASIKVADRIEQVIKRADSKK